MSLTRRDLFKLALGASQVALLSRFGLRAVRAGNPEGPTKLLSIWIDGGVHWESFFAPLTRAGIEKFIPAPSGGLIPWGYSPAQVRNYDGTAADLESTAAVRALRGPIYFNPADPADSTNPIPGTGNAQIYRPYGYIWADPAYKLFAKAALLVGADQGTAAHASGIVASMSGVAGATFRAPAVQAVVANAMAARFPDRPIPNVTLGGIPPAALGLPALANPSALVDMKSVAPTLSDSRDSAWLGLRARTAIPDVNFDGGPAGGTLPATLVDQAILEATRAERGKSTAGTDTLLGQLYDTYRGVSRTIARDILGVLGKIKGWEKLPADPRYPINWTACIGRADTCGNGSATGPYDFALQLLKSDLVTSITLRATSINNFAFDTHSAGGPQTHANHLRIAMEEIGRVIVELGLTPSSRGGGRTLLDDTLVYVYSDFGRTFPRQGSDHHPATCAILAGGNTVGNQMIGGYDEAMNGSPMGAPVGIIEESGERAKRTPRAQDIAATVLRSFALEPGKDFFIPGGYGVFDGVVAGT